MKHAIADPEDIKRVYPSYRESDNSVTKRDYEAAKLQMTGLGGTVWSSSDSCYLNCRSE